MMCSVPSELNHEAGSQLGHDVDDVRDGLGNLLVMVRRTAIELLARAPQNLSTLKVSAGAVVLDMTWTAPASENHSEPVEKLTTVTYDLNTFTVSANTVGVFYRCPSPGTAPFVQEGDQVSPGQQMAIVEAMKLMLPVEADKAGRLIKILVEDCSYIEYGQPLFVLAVSDTGCGNA